jgi:hypothetical protein
MQKITYTYTVPGCPLRRPGPAGSTGKASRASQIQGLVRRPGAAAAAVAARGGHRTPCGRGRGDLIDLWPRMSDSGATYALPLAQWHHCVIYLTTSPTDDRLEGRDSIYPG